MSCNKNKSGGVTRFGQAQSFQPCQLSVCEVFYADSLWSLNQDRFRMDDCLRCDEAKAAIQKQSRKIRIRILRPGQQTLSTNSNGEKNFRLYNYLNGHFTAVKTDFIFKNYFFKNGFDYLATSLPCFSKSLKRFLD